MTELQVGQPALVINVDHKENEGLIGSVIMITDLLSKDESIEYFKDSVYDRSSYSEPFALFEDEKGLAIKQRYLMPIPPLDDVLEQTKLKQPEGETA